jgi:hemerythrin-like domain-containing protein
MCAKELKHQRVNARIRAEDFRDPIEFMYAEHERIRRCCEQLMRLAENPTAEDATELSASILDYIENELPLHVADEEEDLFPLLKQASPTDDRLVSVLELLCVEHQDDIEYGRALFEPLRLISAGQPPADPAMFAHYVRTFAMLQRRHQAVENNVVLPLAFERLTAGNKTELGCKMASRRGIS